MHSKELTKPDGRHLTLYSNRPIPDGMVAPSPFPDPMNANPHLRWHPLRGEWVTYAGFRQNRTFLPPPEYNPLAVTKDPANPTELPARAITRSPCSTTAFLRWRSSRTTRRT
jgi:UDPglucose--hexose-1-phosphate uridylyltransferase